jgi:hypothetical protein
MPVKWRYLKIPVGSVIAGKYSYWPFHLYFLVKGSNERNA